MQYLGLKIDVIEEVFAYKKYQHMLNVNLEEERWQFYMHSLRKNMMQQSWWFSFKKSLCVLALGNMTLVKM